MEERKGVRGGKYAEEKREGRKKKRREAKKEKPNKGYESKTS